MSTNAIAIDITESTQQAPKKSRSLDSTDEAHRSLTPELVIALCGPIGSPLHEVSDQIKSLLSNFQYTAVQIRLSELIRLNADLVQIEIDKTSKFSDINSLITAGDELRKTHGNDVLAKLAIAKISADRIKSYGSFDDKAEESGLPEDKQTKAHRICHIIDSVKNIHELKLLRLIYGEALFSIGVFSPLEIRKRNLSRPGHLTDNEINQLIDTDSGEEFSHGQSVRETFPLCDFFLRVDGQVDGAEQESTNGQIHSKLLRFLNLIFHTNIVSPTLEENAMYSAASAARNSACLSRQVGAAVTSKTGELLSVGWNDVPNSGGGLYGKPQLISGTMNPDQRCHAQTGAKCHNDLEKNSIAEKVIESLIEKAIIDSKNKTRAILSIMQDTRVKDLIEFSRAVHAEMHAILGASRVAGDRILNGKIFITTYPCHSCARHVVAAGISEVYYIEPYRKSLATRLHSDSLTEATESTGFVKLLQFDGVAPRRFIDLFEAGSRKSKSGVLNLSSKAKAEPLTHVSIRAIPRLEEVVIAEVVEKSLRFPELVSKERQDDQENR